MGLAVVGLVARGNVAVRRRHSFDDMHFQSPERFATYRRRSRRSRGRL